MAITGALLGLLASRPMHGYELLKRFAPDTDLGRLYHLEMGQMYALLHRLEGDGLVEAELIPQGPRPPRKVYHLSQRGHAAFHEWVRGPVAKVRDLRIEFLLKLYFARHIGAEAVAALLAGQAAVCREEIERLERARQSCPEGFARLVYASRIGRARALLEWLGTCRDEAAREARTMATLLAETPAGRLP